MKECSELQLCGCVSFRGNREERSSTGKTNQPQPATHSSPHPGGDDLLPPNRGGFPLQAEGTRGGRQEDAGGAPELSDSMFVWNQMFMSGYSSAPRAWLKKFWLLCLCWVTRFVSDPFASLSLTMFESGKAFIATLRHKLALGWKKKIDFLNSTHHSLGGIQKALCLRLGIKYGEDRNRHCCSGRTIPRWDGLSGLEEGGLNWA